MHDHQPVTRRVRRRRSSYNAVAPIAGAATIGMALGGPVGATVGAIAGLAFAVYCDLSELRESIDSRFARLDGHATPIRVPGPFVYESDFGHWRGGVEVRAPRRGNRRLFEPNKGTPPAPPSQEESADLPPPGEKATRAHG